MPTWLPNKKYYEFAYHKFFNPEITFDSWIPWDQWDYPDRDILRFEQIIANQQDYIKNKRVLDLACHLGYMSLFCLHNDATYVTGTNVRNRELSIANEICSRAGYDNYSFVNSNLCNIDELTKLCNNHDTILLSGILYHINNHYEVLKTIANSTASTLIVETLLSDQIDQDIPTMFWTTESTEVSVYGYKENAATIFVGIPSRSWVEHALIDLGYNIVYNNVIEYVREHGQFTRRCIITGIK